MNKTSKSTTAKALTKQWFEDIISSKGGYVEKSKELNVTSRNYVRKTPFKVRLAIIRCCFPESNLQTQVSATSEKQISDRQPGKRISKNPASIQNSRQYATPVNKRYLKNLEHDAEQYRKLKKYFSKKKP